MGRTFLHQRVGYSVGGDPRGTGCWSVRSLPSGSCPRSGSCPQCTAGSGRLRNIRGRIPALQGSARWRTGSLINHASCGIGLLGFGGLVWVTSRIPEWLGVPSSEAGWLIWPFLLGYFGIVGATFFVRDSIKSMVTAFKKARLLRSSVLSRIEQYEEALRLHNEAVRKDQLKQEEARRKAEQAEEAERAQRRRCGSTGCLSAELNSRRN